MNTNGWIVYGLDHHMFVFMQAMQLIGAYSASMPAAAEARTEVLRAIEAWSNARLAHRTDWVEHTEPLVEQRMIKAVAELRAASHLMTEFKANAEGIYD